MFLYKNFEIYITQKRDFLSQSPFVVSQVVIVVLCTQCARAAVLFPRR